MLRRVVLSVTAALGVAGCGWLIPDDRDVPDGVRRDVEQMTDDIPPIPGQAPCEVLLDRLRRVATAKDPDGVGEWAWFIAPTDAGGRWDWVTELDEEGESIGGGGGGGGCEPTPGVEPDGLWWSGGGGSETEVYHGGHAPEGATSVRLTFGDHPPVTVPVDDGYFFIVLGESACCEFGFPDQLDALAADGNAIDSTNRPLG